MRSPGPGYSNLHLFIDSRPAYVCGAGDPNSGLALGATRRRGRTARVSSSIRVDDLANVWSYVSSHPGDIEARILEIEADHAEGGRYALCDSIEQFPAAKKVFLFEQTVTDPGFTISETPGIEPYETTCVRFRL